MAMAKARIKRQTDRQNSRFIANHCFSRWLTVVNLDVHFYYCHTSSVHLVSSTTFPSHPHHPWPLSDQSCTTCLRDNKTAVHFYAGRDQKVRLLKMAVVGKRGSALSC